MQQRHMCLLPSQETFGGLLCTNIKPAIFNWARSYISVLQELVVYSSMFPQNQFIFDKRKYFCMHGYLCKKKKIWYIEKEFFRPRMRW